jgi:c-di-GMP-binding flagellar brake protein YcgR
VAFDLAPRAKVQTSDFSHSIGSGVVLDLSGTGMRMRIATEREVLVGELLQISVKFPNSIPSFEGLVEVVHVFPSRIPDARILGLRFVDERADIARAIHELDLKRHGRDAA